eukprot:ctg_2091.g430
MDIRSVLGSSLWGRDGSALGRKERGASPGTRRTVATLSPVGPG